MSKFFFFHFHRLFVDYIFIIYVLPVRRLNTQFNTIIQDDPYIIVQRFSRRILSTFDFSFSNYYGII